MRILYIPFCLLAFNQCATPIHKKPLTLKSYDHRPKEMTVLIERGDINNLYNYCKIDMSNPDLHFAKLIYPNHINHIWPEVILRPVSFPETGLNLAISITIEERYNAVWRAWQLMGMLATLGLYAPARTYDLKLTYALLDFESPPKDISPESFKGHISFLGEYSIYVPTYTKFLLGNLLPYRPDESNCNAISEELTESIISIREEFSRDLKRAFP